MWRTALVAAGFSVLTFAAGSLDANAAPGAVAPPVTWATWITRDVEINFQNLPRTYSCNDLWYKLHGILLAIGAREYMSIAPYNCKANAQGGGRSPSVDVKFQTLRVLTGAEARWAQTSATRKTVRLGPGEPRILDPGDCALLSQVEGALFTYLNMHVVASDLECSSEHAARTFSVVVDTVIATPSSHSTS